MREEPDPKASSLRRFFFLATLAFCQALPTISTAAASERAELIVFAAASLRDVFEQLAKTFEGGRPGTRVRFNFAGSQELRLQIEQGARADVFASADQKQMARLVTQGAARTTALFARNDLIVVVPRGAPGGKAAVRTFAELPRARRIVVGAPEVPVGAYTAEALRRASAKLGTSFAQAVESHIVSRELNVRQVLAKVVLGEADAGIVYRTDALAARDKVEAIEIPRDVNVTADYPVAALKDSAHPELAQAFVGHLTSPAAQKTLEAAGFVPASRGPP